MAKLTKEEEVLLSSYSPSSSTKGTLFFYVNALIISLAPIYLFYGVHQMEIADSWIVWAISSVSTAYLLALSSLVGGIFTFPLGVLGSMKAVGLGVSSGLTLSAVVHLYAMSIDKSVDEAYRIFKRDYEKELKSASEWDQRVSKLMEDENIKWRQTAVKRLKEIDHEKLSAQDDF